MRDEQNKKRNTAHIKDASQSKLFKRIKQLDTIISEAAFFVSIPFEEYESNGHLDSTTKVQLVMDSLDSLDQAMLEIIELKSNMVKLFLSK